MPRARSRSSLENSAISILIISTSSFLFLCCGRSHGGAVRRCVRGMRLRVSLFESASSTLFSIT